MARRAGLLAALLVVTAHAALAAELSAKLDRSSVEEGEPIELQLRGTDLEQAPDLRPLTRDFEILGTGQSQRTTILNGRAESTHEWSVQLLPRRSGALEVPALTAGDATSKALPLEVLVAGAAPSQPRDDDANGATDDDATARGAAPGAQAHSRSAREQGTTRVPDGASRDLFVEAAVDQMAPWVHGEVNLSVKIYDGVGMRSGRLVEPRIEGATVKGADEGETYTEEIDGRSYLVHERTYKVVPEKSGELRISPFVVEAAVPDPRGRRAGAGSVFDRAFGGNPFAGMGGGVADSFFEEFFDTGRPVRVRSNPITLDVQGRPEGAGSGWFLPARKVTLEESFEPAEPKFRVGEPVRRTVTLYASGASADQLPRFEIPAADATRQYDEGTREGTRPGARASESAVERTVSIVPRKAGKLTFPAVEVRWWDTEHDEARTATLPSREVEVLPAVGAAADTTGAAAGASDAAATVAKKAPSQAASAEASPPSRDVGAGSTAQASKDVTPASATAPTERSSATPPSGVLVAIALAVGVALGAVFGRMLVRMRRRRAELARDAAGFPVTPYGTATGAAEQGSPAAAATSVFRAPIARSSSGSTTAAAEVEAACNANDPRAARAAFVRWGRELFPEAHVTTPTAIARHVAEEALSQAIAEIERALFAAGGADGGWSGASLLTAFRTAERAVSPGPRRHRGDSAELPPLYPESDAPRRSVAS